MPNDCAWTTIFHHVVSLDSFSQMVHVLTFFSHNNKLMAAFHTNLLWTIKSYVLISHWRATDASYFIFLFFFLIRLSKYGKKLIRHCAAIVCQRWDWSGGEKIAKTANRNLHAARHSRQPVPSSFANWPKKALSMLVRSQRYSAGERMKKKKRLVDNKWILFLDEIWRNLCRCCDARLTRFAILSNFVIFAGRTRNLISRHTKHQMEKLWHAFFSYRFGVSSVGHSEIVGNLEVHLKKPN